LDKEIPFLFSTQGPLKDLSPAKYVPKKQLLKGGRAPAENPFEIANQLKVFVFVNFEWGVWPCTKDSYLFANEHREGDISKNVPRTRLGSNKVLLCNVFHMNV